MAEDVRSILNVEKGEKRRESRPKETKKKPGAFLLYKVSRSFFALEHVNREVFALTGGIPPLIPVHEKPANSIAVNFHYPRR